MLFVAGLVIDWKNWSAKGCHDVTRQREETITIDHHHFNHHHSSHHHRHHYRHHHHHHNHHHHYHHQNQNQNQNQNHVIIIAIINVVIIRSSYGKAIINIILIIIIELKS